MKKRLLIVLSLTVMLFSCGFLFCNAETVASGDCGSNEERDNVKWQLSDTGVLTIYGEGAMDDYNSGGQDWREYAGTVTSVKIEQGVTHIGENAFSMHNALQTANISGSVKTIGTEAFSHCKKLSSVTVQDGSLTEIGEDAFLYDTNLFRIVLPNSLRVISDGAFSACGLANYTVPEGVTIIGESAFSSCEMLGEITLPSTLRTLGAVAFSGCTRLKQITLPEGITEVPIQAFEGCSALTTVSLPSTLKTVNESAFYKSAISSIDIPDGVYLIDDSAFSDCDKLTSVNLPDSLRTIGEEAFSDCNNLNELYIPDGVQQIKQYAFSNTPLATGISLPASLTSIEELAFDSPGKITFRGTKAQWNAIKKDEYPFSDEVVTIHCTDGDIVIDYSDDTGDDDPDPNPNPPAKNNELDFSKDVWNVGNYTDDQCFDNEDLIPYIYDLSPIGRALIKDKLNRKGKGHCFGMSATVILQKIGEEDFTRFDRDASYLRQLLGYGIERRYICYYQAVQYLLDNEAEYERVSKLSPKERLAELANKANRVRQGGSPVMLIFEQEGWGAHAVVAYALQKGSFSSSVTNKQYNRRVRIYDCNSVDWDQDYCLLFNEGSSDWEIPFYEKRYQVSSAHGANIINIASNYTVFDKKEDTRLNTLRPTVHFQASGIYTLKQKDTNEQWTINTDTGSVEGNTELLRYLDSNDGSGIVTGLTVILPSDTGTYVIEPKTINSEIKVDALSTDKYLSVNANSAKGAEIDLSGTVALKGNNGNYQLTEASNAMQADSNYDTFSVSGSGVGDKMLKIEGQNATVSGDNVKGATLTASNAEDSTAHTIGENGSHVFSNNESDYGENHYHNWNTTYTVDTEATCSAEGSESIHCANCDATKGRRVIAKTAHSYGSWQTTSAATELAVGQQARKCTVCGNVETKTIAQLAPTLPTVKIKKPKAAKKKVTVKWKKVSKKNLKKISKIQIQVATDPGFTNIVKTTTAGKKKTSKTIKGLKRKTKYYVRIRAYAAGDHVSAWKSKSVKVK